MKILMVCLGNICRSPLAEGILRHKLEQRNIPAIVDSAGTSNYHEGLCPDERSIENAKSHGIDISNLCSRPFTEEDFDKFDHIYVMDSSNYNNVLSLARNDNDRKKVDLILNVVEPGKNNSVPDPYFGGKQGFENVYNLLDQACEIIAERLSKELNSDKR